MDSWALWLPLCFCILFSVLEGTSGPAGRDCLEGIWVTVYQPPWKASISSERQAMFDEEQSPILARWREYCIRVWMTGSKASFSFLPCIETRASAFILISKVKGLAQSLETAAPRISEALEYLWSWLSSPRVRKLLHSEWLSLHHPHRFHLGAETLHSLAIVSPREAVFILQVGNC